MAYDDDNWGGGEDSEEGVNAINITPLVDVCLVLVLIFMVTSPFMAKQLMEVQLPQASTSETEDKENITITMSVDKGWAINEIPVDRRALPLELKEHLKASGFSFVLIRADENVTNGEVQDVMKICKQAKVSRIAFATNPK